MTPPGVRILERVAVPAATQPTDTGTFFVAAAAPQGPSAPTLVETLDAAIARFGARDPVGGLYDALDVFFHEGGRRAYVARVTGSGAVAATFTLKDAGNTNTLVVTANGPGVWGNNLSLQVVAGTAAGTYSIKVTLSGVLVEQSPDLATAADGAAWANQSSKYLTAAVTGAAGAPKVIAATPLASGADGSAVVDADFVSALDRFSQVLGPGQIAAPGRTTTTVQAALLAHAGTHNRVALVDAADSASASTLASAAAALAGANARYGSMFAPWVQVQGVAPGTTRTVPPSPVAAGLIARTDPRLGPGTPAAGDQGISATAVGLTQSFPLDADRDTINQGGVCLFRQMYGTVRLYGYRTLANPSSQQAYLQLSQIRVLMALTARLNAVAERHVFRKIDGAGHEFSAFKGDLAGVCLGFYQADELYGATPQDAFYVDVGSSVNTPDTIAAGELHAVVAVRVSPFAELVVIELVKTPITQEVAA